MNGVSFVRVRGLTIDFNSATDRGMMESVKILIIERDCLRGTDIATKLQQLKDNEVIRFGDEKDAIEFASDAHVDVILLPHAPPAFDGTELIRIIRSRQITCPVIMISSSHAEREIVRGIEAGASDYVTIPCSFVVLHALIRARLQYYQESENAMLRLGPYVFDVAQRCLIERDSAMEIRLTNKEAQLLKELYRAGTGSITKDALMNRIWGYGPEINTHTVETHIHRLRQKLEFGGKYGKLIITGPKGYRLSKSAP